MGEDVPSKGSTPSDYEFSKDELYLNLYNKIQIIINSENEGSNSLTYVHFCSASSQAFVCRMSCGYGSVIKNSCRYSKGKRTPYRYSNIPCKDLCYSKNLCVTKNFSCKNNLKLIVF